MRPRRPRQQHGGCRPPFSPQPWKEPPSRRGRSTSGDGKPAAAVAGASDAPDLSLRRVHVLHNIAGTAGTSSPGLKLSANPREPPVEQLDGDLRTKTEKQHPLMCDCKKSLPGQQHVHVSLRPPFLTNEQQEAAMAECRLNFQHAGSGRRHGCAATASLCSPFDETCDSPSTVRKKGTASPVVMTVKLVSHLQGFRFQHAGFAASQRTS